MSEIDRSEAMARLESLFAESKANNESTAISKIVEAVLGKDADEEINEMVLMAMESRSSSIPTRRYSMES